MSWIAVTRKDFQDAVRSRLLWGLLGLVTLVGLLVVWVYSSVAGPSAIVGGGVGSWVLTLGLVGLLTGLGIGGFGPMPVLVPLVGLLVGYKAVVSERESGQIKILLGLPHSRRDVIAGKFLGRSGVAAVAVGAGLVITGLVAALALGGLAPGIYLEFVLLTVAFAVTHVAIGVGISAVAPSNGWAVAMLVGFVIVFQLLWGALTTAISLVVFGTDPEPTWFELVRNITPGAAYGDALNTVLGLSAIRRVAGPGAGPPTGGEPFYLADWFGFVVLAVWTVVPVVVGYLRFRGVDLA